MAERLPARAQRAKRRLVKLLAGEPGFVGAGISAGTSGECEITVLVVDAASPVVAKIPTDWEGIPVRTKVGGIPRKL